MKNLRLWLLVLLALLLPLRSAMATVVACPASQSTPHPAASRHGGHEGHHHQAQAGKALDRSHACTGCCDLCSTPSMVADLPAVLAPLAFSGVAYPALSSQPPTFLSDGQERPPRST